jgi:hypothetical protein
MTHKIVLGGTYMCMRYGGTCTYTLCFERGLFWSKTSAVLNFGTSYILFIVCQYTLAVSDNCVYGMLSEFLTCICEQL